MPGNERVFAEAPIVVDEVDVGMADSAMRDPDFNFLVFHLTGIVLIRQQMRTGRVDGQTVYLTHSNPFPYRAASLFRSMF
jgi:hypothetical protein